MKCIINWTILFFLSLNMPAQHENGLVKWYDFKEAQELNKKAPKPFLVDVYTDWCGWCKHMMKTTYSDPGLANYINTYFYPVKFNAETKDSIEYNGRVYKTTSSAPKAVHELAIKFLGSNLSYPSTIFISNNFEYNLLSQGYLDVQKIEPLLVYTVENVYRNSSYDDFSADFHKTFYDTTVKSQVKIHSLKEIEQLQKKDPRKVLINISAGFCNACKVQTKATFADTSIANYINKHFYIMNFDAEQQDTIFFGGEKFYKTPVNGYPLNTFALKVTNNRLVFPTIAVLDENNVTLDALNYYLNPAALKPILVFYAKDYYKTLPWTDFIKQYHENKLK